MTYQPCGIFNAKSIHDGKQLWYFLTHRWMDKVFILFLSPKVNVTTRLGFELAYSDVVVQNASHYTMGTFPGIYRTNKFTLQNFYHVNFSSNILAQMKSDVLSICFVSFFSGISTIVSYSMPKPSL